MLRNVPGIAKLLMWETSIFQLVQSHLDDERESIKNFATGTMEQFFDNIAGTSINHL